MKVSVVIPVHNGEKTLENCLNSVLNQTYKNYEIIVVDNNSTDNTKKIVDKFKRDSNKIKYFFEKKIGRGATRNTGIKNSKGSIIVMIDCDCVAPSHWLKELTKPIIDGEEEIVMGGEKDLVGNFWTKNIQEANLRFIKRNLRGKYSGHIDTKNFAIKSSIIKKFMFDSEIGNMEDLDLYLRIKDRYNILFLKNADVGHYHRNSFLDFIKTNFDRSYWVFKIYEKHKSRENPIAYPMFDSLNFKNLFLTPLWVMLQFFKKSFKEALFIIVSELSWRVGLLIAYFKK
ncbi:MAG: glycosyltransferase [archaeon]